MLPHLCDPLSRVELRNMRQLKVRYALKVDTSPQALQAFLSDKQRQASGNAFLSAYEKLEGLLRTACSALLFPPSVVL